MQLREVGPAEPGGHQFCQIFLAPVVAPVGPAELFHVEPGLEAGDEPIEGPGEELLPQPRLGVGLLRCGDHVLRPDRDVVGRVRRPVDRRVHEVDAAVRLFRRLRQEDVRPVGVHAGDGTAEDLLHVVPLLGRKAQAVVACGEGAEDQFVGEGLHGVTQAGVWDVVLVELQLIQVDELGIERVEELRLEGQRLQVDEPVPDLTGDPVPEAAVEHLQGHVPRVAVRHQAEALEVVRQPVEALHALLQGSGHRLGLGAGLPVPEREGSLQALAGGGLDRFSRGEPVRLREAPDLRPLEVEAADVVNAEQVPGHQLHRLAAQGRAVHAFALGEAEEPRDDLDHKLRQRRPEVPLVGVQVIQEAPRAQLLHLFHVRVLRRLPGVFHDGGEVRGGGDAHPISSATAAARSSSIPWEIFAVSC